MRWNELMQCTFKTMRRKGIYVLLISCCSCMSLPEGVKESLELAGENRGELKKVLRHYSWHAGDSLKFRAACFLIDHMRWHYSSGRVSYIDPQFGVFCHQLDSLYYQIYQQKGKDSLALCRNIFRKEYKWLADSIRRYKFQPSQIQPGRLEDLKVFDAEFLISHIDNAFRQWETAPDAQKLNFKEFCEYILPYRSLDGYPYQYSGKTLHDLYGKYIYCNRQEENLRNFVGRYNFVVLGFRNFLGRKPQEEIGLYNLFFNGHECTDIATFGCNILRACGIPVMIEYCSAFRDFAGRHFYCVIPDSTGKWITFNPESSVPGAGKWVSARPMNLYREYYSAQKDAPYFLKASDEYLPSTLDSPFLKEVTAEHSEVFPVTLSFPVETGNHLAYLAAFQARQDIVPVTWGKIDTVGKQVTFANVMPDRLYFPVYYEKNELKSFGAPFYIVKDTTVTKGYSFYTCSSDSDEKQKVILTRKFPRKPKLVEAAGHLIGTEVLGANKADFSDARSLCALTTSPVFGYQDMIIRHPRPYRYYRVVAPEKFPWANISEVQLLTSRKWGYDNYIQASYRSILSPEDTLKRKEDRQWVRLIDTATWVVRKHWLVNDGNVQTAPPSRSRMIKIELACPQVVERIRFAPRHADNGIKAGDDYELFYWGTDGWTSCGRQIACYEYLEFPDVPVGRIFWLRNYSSGKEELPFIIEDGEQLFFYYDMINLFED